MSWIKFAKTWGIDYNIGLTSLNCTCVRRNKITEFIVSPYINDSTIINQMEGNQMASKNLVVKKLFYNSVLKKIF